MDRASARGPGNSGSGRGLHPRPSRLFERCAHLHPGIVFRIKPMREGDDRSRSDRPVLRSRRNVREGTRRLRGDRLLPISRRTGRRDLATRSDDPYRINSSRPHPALRSKTVASEDVITLPRPLARRSDLELTFRANVARGAAYQRLKSSRLHHECLLVHIPEGQLLGGQRKGNGFLFARF